MPSAQYTSIYNQVIEWTKKPAMISETNNAIRSAVRNAHKIAKFWRDLVVVQVSNVTVAELQSIDLSVYSDFRQIAYVKHPSRETHLTPVDILNLHDDDQLYRKEVYYGLGSTLQIRDSAPSSSYTLGYYKYPIITPIESLSTWIADQHEDVIILRAAATILALINEQEVKTRVESLYAEARRDLLSDALEIQGR